MSFQGLLPTSKKLFVADLLAVYLFLLVPFESTEIRMTTQLYRNKHKVGSVAQPQDCGPPKSNSVYSPHCDNMLPSKAGNRTFVPV